jgi:ribonuclease G
MSKEIYISSTPHETRLAIVEDDALTEIYYERENEYTLAGSIYNGRVTRVLPGMQSSFVEIGLERDAFLYITDFMEEAGDSADFEAAHAGGGEARAPRSEGQRRGERSERGERQDRGERPDRPAPVLLEGNLDASAERPQEGRTDRSEQNGRGERSGRGRNRRGRGDRNRPDRIPAPVPAEAEGAEAPVFTPPSLPVEVESLGEGAPGADGSRRWRGRRGRRRGRGASGQPGEATPAVSGESEFPEYTVEVDSTLQLDAPESETRRPTAPILNAYPDPYTGEDEPARSAPPRDGQGRGDRNGRNDRNDRNDRGDRNGRGGRPERGERAPRGFAPSASRYGVDASDSVEAPAEPIILPGESLSKYRRGSEPESAAASTSSLPPNVIVPKPANIIDDSFVAASWDGGAVLPGETLSRRSRPDSRSDSRPDPRRDQARVPRQESRQHFATPPAEQPPVIADAVGVSVQSAPDRQQEVAEAAHLDQIPAAEMLHETASPFTSDVPAPLDPIAAVPEPTAPEAEYEPVEASASFRVDPAAPSEFRQSAPVLENVIEEELIEDDLIEEHQEEDILSGEIPHAAAAPQHGPAEPEVTLHVDHSHPFNRLDEADAEIEPHAVELETATTATEQTLPQIAAVASELDTTGVPPPPPPFGSKPEAASAHSDITSLSPTGEMHSEAAALPAVETAYDPTSPILHESSIHEAGPVTFSPGTGQLEEELIDDEEHEPTTLHAFHEEEFDDLEEETLEGAADLGTMIREMSIDQITRTGDGDAEDDEDDDLEEEESASTAGYGTEEFEEEEGYVEGDKPAAQSAADAEFFANTFREPGAEAASDSQRSESDRRPRREGGRRDGRDRNRSRSTGGDSDRSRHGGGGQRRTMQATNLPAISDLLKPGQEILVQIAKEPIAKKGARITSHIALPGRFLVFMPTVSHTGVSRKIESDAERRRLKEILLSEKGDAAGGFIVRTAAAGASEDELRSDLRFLLNLWTDIKQRSESSKSPALIYHDLNLVERILRDQVTDNFSAIWVDTESEYERVLRFLQRFQPQLIRRVKLYTKETPLFEQFGITEEINKALRSKVWLKSGGSIVINQTEALVAIDINTGKFVGKTARLEDTIVKTNLDAIPEIVRQIRLRDLGGIIIIDFIDMDERKNRNKVMAALEEELKSDRAPSKVLQFNDFGLVAITRKRVKQSLERTLSTTCGVCQGTGMVKSPITVCNDIYIEMRKMHKHLERGDVMLRVHPEVVKQLKSGTSKWLQEMEEMVGKTILVKSDPSLHPEQFDIH